MSGFDRGWPAVSVFVALLSLAACGADTQTSEPLAREPTSIAIHETSTSAFGADPDGEDWFLSDAWMETTPCRSKAQLVYTHAGLRMRGKRWEDQTREFRARPDIETLDPATKAAFEALLERVYATPVAQLPDMGTRIAADCLASAPQVGVDRERALRCYRRYQEEYTQHLYRDRKPRRSNTESADLDFKFRRCLRGDPI